MKRIIIALVAGFFMCLGVQAQVKFHGQIGMTFSTFDRDLMEEYGFLAYRQSLLDQGVNASTSARNSIRPGAVIGIEMDVYLNENTFLKTGVKYTNGGDSYFFKTTDVQIRRLYGLITSDARFRYRPRLDYIAIPLNYGKSVNDFTFYGGVTTHINMATALRTNSFELSIGNVVEEDWDRVDDLIAATETVFFLNVGANYLLPAFNVDNIVSLNIGYSLNPVYNQPGATGDINGAHLWIVELAFGITLSTGGN